MTSNSSELWEDHSGIKDVVNTPRGVGVSSFRGICNAGETAYRVKSNMQGDLSPLPTLEEIKRFTGYSERLIVKVMTSLEFKNEMSRRGINWTDNIRFKLALSSEQQFVIAIITNPTDRRPMTSKLKSAGINYNIYRNWLKNPVFKEAVTKIAEDMIQDNISTAHTRLVQRVDTGDIQAIKLLYEVSGRHDPARQNNLDIMRMIGLLLEVITRHVTDPSVINKISSDVELIIQGKVPASLKSNEVPANYIPSEAYLKGELVPNHSEIETIKTQPQRDRQAVGTDTSIHNEHEVGLTPEEIKKKRRIEEMAAKLKIDLAPDFFDYIPD